MLGIPPRPVSPASPVSPPTPNTKKRARTAERALGPYFFHPFLASYARGSVWRAPMEFFVEKITANHMPLRFLRNLFTTEFDEPDFGVAWKRANKDVNFKFKMLGREVYDPEFFLEKNGVLYGRRIARKFMLHSHVLVFRESRECSNCSMVVQSSFRFVCRECETHLCHRCIEEKAIQCGYKARTVPNKDDENMCFQTRVVSETQKLREEVRQLRNGIAFRERQCLRLENENACLRGLEHDIKKLEHELSISKEKVTEYVPEKVDPDAGSPCKKSLQAFEELQNC
jgi:hypothetical protein